MTKLFLSFLACSEQTDTTMVFVFQTSHMWILKWDQNCFSAIEKWISLYFVSHYCLFFSKWPHSLMDTLNMLIYITHTHQGRASILRKKKLGWEFKARIFKVLLVGVSYCIPVELCVLWWGERGNFLLSTVWKKCCKNANCSESIPLLFMHHWKLSLCMLCQRVLSLVTLPHTLPHTHSVNAAILLVRTSVIWRIYFSFLIQ